MIRFAVKLCLAIILLTSCNLNVPGGQDFAQSSMHQDPHGKCENCHATANPQENDKRFAFGLDPSILCGYCHNDYTENHHPVNFEPAMAVDPEFPLFDKKIKCLTCHEMHAGQELSNTTRLLRGGPYSDRRQSCFRCHDSAQYSGINPHKMLDTEGNIRLIDGKPVCLVCHSKRPNPLVDRTEDVRFRADVGFLCWRCHPPMPGSFFDEHFLVTPEPETLDYMVASESRLDIISPLVPRGRITCSTCHNPHQEGVMWHSGAAKGADALHRLRLHPNCIACHSD